MNDDLVINVSNVPTKQSASYEPPVVPSQASQPTDYDLSAASHPMVCIFTFTFKALAIVIYLIGGFFLSDTLIFILVIILNAFDFWTVKNVSGRLLVGLRWWSEYNEKGEEIWKFESHDKEFAANKVDTAFFWTSQISSFLGWAVLFVIKVLSLSVFWGILTLSGVALSGTNLYGYYLCNSQYKNKLTAMKNEAMGSLANRVMGNFFSR